MICAGDGKGGATVSSKIKDDFNKSLPYPAKNIKKRKKKCWGWGGGEIATEVQVKFKTQRSNSKSKTLCNLFILISYSAFCR